MVNSTTKPVAGKLAPFQTTHIDPAINLSKISSEAASFVPSERANVDTGDAQPQWKPNSQEWLTLLCLSVVSMVVALDTNILVPVLPVSWK
jgi:hypothetical protein